MKLLPYQVYHLWRWSLVCFFALSILCIAIGIKTTVTAQAGGFQVQVEEGQKISSPFRITNTCLEPHHYRIKHDIKYISFDESTDFILVAPGARKPLNAIFDATGLKSQVYKDVMTVECLDCKEEKISRCTHQDKVPVQLTVTKRQPAALAQMTPVIPTPTNPTPRPLLGSTSPVGSLQTNPVVNIHLVFRWHGVIRPGGGDGGVLNSPDAISGGGGGGGGGCSEPLGICITRGFSIASGPLTKAQIADGYGTATFQVDGDRLHMIFQHEAALKNGTIPIDQDNYLKPDISAALGYESIMLKAGVYKVDRSKERFGEMFVDIVKRDPVIPDTSFDLQLACCRPGNEFHYCDCIFERCQPLGPCNFRWSGGLSSINLALLTTFQDNILSQSERGKYYGRFFYFHRPAIASIFLTEPALASRAVGLIDRLSPGLERMINGSGEQSRVTADLITEIGSFSESLANAAQKQGRPNLAADIRREIKPFIDKKLVGMTYPEAWKQISVQNAPANDLTNKTTAIPEATPGKDIALSCCQCLGGVNTLDLSTVSTNNWTINGKPVFRAPHIQAWNIDTGPAQWITGVDSSYMPKGTYTYSLKFVIPVCLINQTITLSGSYGADNSVEVYLDTKLLSKCTGEECFKASSIRPPFNNVPVTPGAHTLNVKVYNAHPDTQSGMFLNAKVTGVCVGQAPVIVGPDPRRF